MGCDFNEHGELSDRYKDLWAKKVDISWKLMSNMSFDDKDAKWNVNRKLSKEIDQLSDQFVDLLAEHLQIPPNIYAVKCS